MTGLLEIAELSVAAGATTIVDRVSFTLDRGRTLGLVGESGSGKSMIARAIMRLLPRGVAITQGRIALEGDELVNAHAKRMRDIRGARIGMVFQEPMTSLDPCFTIGWQVAESLRIHGRKATRAIVGTALQQAGLDDAAGIQDRHPHLLSGGQRQRVLIAAALACAPALLIADEPTTALDTTVQKRILDLLETATRTRALGLLLITHDLGVVAERADDIVVLYAGTIVERGPAADVLAAPRHPYTAALLACRPRLNGARTRLPAIAGGVPSPDARADGCAFRPRCGRATSQCLTRPPMEGSPHASACWHGLA